LIEDKHRLTVELEQKNQELAASNSELAKQKYLLEYELEMAKTVYSKAALYGHDEIDGLDYLLSAKETVGGDFLLNHVSNDGQTLYLMMGDLTGHGLQSALAVLLVAEVFDVLCASSPKLEQLAQGINDKMCLKLPTGLFCAALLLKLDVACGRLYIWLGGMPEAYFLDAQGRVIKTLSSNNLALGVSAEQDFSDHISSHAADEAVSLFLCSDGVTEQTGMDQSMFGIDRLYAALRDTPATQPRVNYVIAQLRAHQQQQTQSDDISLLELNLPRISKALEYR
jgi:two-component system, HptB-dependent secretion and biofilm response regulator